MSANTRGGEIVTSFDYRGNPISEQMTPVERAAMEDMMSLVKWVSSYQIGIHKSEDCEVPVIPLADLTELVEGLREIAGEVVCDGPGCNRCEDGLSHMPTPGARTAQLLLAQLEAHRKEG